MTGIKPSQAVRLDQTFQAGADMSSREKKILTKIVSRTQFKPEKVIWRSSYWGTTQIGAIHYQGTFKGQPAVLKIQGVKPEVSEILMIKEFAAQNRSKIIRPPKLYQTLSWQEAKGYEALIMESVAGKKILQSGQLQSKEKISQFFDYYQEYRKNCLPKKPWLPKPKKTDWHQNLKNFLSTSQRAYPSHPLRQPNDKKLATQAFGLLKEIYQEEFEITQSGFIGKSRNRIDS